MHTSRESSQSGLIRRWVEVLALFGIWFAAGLLLDMSQNGYLVLGIPLIAGFQLFVRKRPIKDLWVRGGPGLSLRRISLKLAILAILLAIYPFVNLVITVVRGQQGLDIILYLLAAIVGAGAAAYALGQFRRSTWRYLGLCLVIVSLAAAVFYVLDILIFRTLIEHHVITHPPTVGMEPTALGRIETWISSLLLYIPALFLMEEVAFRGAIDSHVYHAGESQGVESSTIYAIVSAIMVSVLWGLWHFPITSLPPEFAHASVFVHVALVAPLEVIVGPFLSLFWRRSGNLMVPAFAHAMNDSVRNALGGTP